MAEVEQGVRGGGRGGRAGLPQDTKTSYDQSPSPQAQAPQPSYVAPLAVKRPSKRLVYLRD